MQAMIEYYHGLGFPLVFLQPKTKIPLQKNWSKTGFLPNQLKAFKPGMNAGIKLGHRLENGNYLAAIDVDITDNTCADEVWTLLSTVAPTHKTWPKVTSGRGNGSGHFYFLSPHPITSKTLGSGAKNGKKAWEVSLMGIGRQCVAPPSIHPSGKTYEWEVDLFSLSVEILKSTEIQDDLTDLKIAPEVKSTIRNARVKDRSHSLYVCTVALLRSKVADALIIDIFTNLKYLLAHVTYEHTNSQDITKASAWYVKYILEPAKAKLGKQGDLTRNKNGHITPTYHNAKILTCGEIFKDETFLKHNTFRNTFEWCQSPPWVGSSLERSSGREDALLLGDYLLDEHGVRFASNTLDELISTEALKNSYHPVRDYLDNLTWDGIPRLATLFQTYHSSNMAASYLDEVALLWMVGAVNRIYVPGAKFDYVLVLEGVQGVGKSTFLETLASKPWFLDSLPNLMDKDAATNIQGAWICEIAELAAMNRSTLDMVKAYLSRSVDRVRPPYGHRRVDFPRSTVFAGSTNLKHYLHDPTGARRFWPVTVGRCMFKQLKRDRDQLWAEAAFIYHYNKPILYPSFSLEAHLKYLHAERRVDDEGDEAKALLLSWVASHDKVPALTLAELYTHGPLVVMKRTRSSDIRATSALEEMGFVAHKVNGIRYWLLGENHGS